MLARLQEKAALTLAAGLRHVVRTPAAGAVCGQCRAARPSRWREKYEALKGMQIDRMLCVRFTHRFAEQAASTFIEQLLVEKLWCTIWWSATIFASARGGKGLPPAGGGRSALRVRGDQHPEFPAFPASGSAALVREALKAGRMAEVELMLGRPYAISGRVAHGDKLGAP